LELLWAWPAYLESSPPRNITFYERHGLVARDEIAVDGGPPLLGRCEPLVADRPDASYVHARQEAKSG
jgi:hypothetical protein